MVGTVLYGGCKNLWLWGNQWQGQCCIVAVESCGCRKLWLWGDQWQGPCCMVTVESCCCGVISGRDRVVWWL